MTGIVATTAMVRDLTRSASWYCEVLDLQFIREFTVDGAVWGVVLHDRDADFVIVLQDLSTVPGVRDLHGSRPLVLNAPSRETVENLAGRFGGLGLDPRGPVTDPDGTVVDVVDPDGIILRVRHVTSPPDTGFQGVAYDADGTVTGIYATPALDVATP
ncbi:Glyoxalase-like domain protein [Streptomyces sp. S4.7]|uniref:VOC family protein n=1 Tax=Streptomyces sp. S4.7 TaxID=2705439 RepID=UPI0013984962|nr:VOC family protein [Streptomyces sp. S4.7]QHY94231.1 Glyoxalase-like domain protein [Streptomyces sp. S4.7]